MAPRGMVLWRGVPAGREGLAGGVSRLVVARYVRATPPWEHEVLEAAKAPAAQQSVWLQTRRSALGPSSEAAFGAFSCVNAKRLALKKPTVGFANPALYKWAGDASIFHDITSGSNECTALGGGGLGTLPVCCPHSGFRAEKGWDAATGLGSVNVGNIIEAWAAL